MKKATISVDEKLLEEAKDAVVWMQGRGVRHTLSSFISKAVSGYLSRLKKEYKISSFPVRKCGLAKGRPLS